MSVNDSYPIVVGPVRRKSKATGQRKIPGFPDFHLQTTPSGNGKAQLTSNYFHKLNIRTVVGRLDGLWNASDENESLPAGAGFFSDILSENPNEKQNSGSINAYNNELLAACLLLPGRPLDEVNSFHSLVRSY